MRHRNEREPELHFVVSREQAGERLDHLVAQTAHVSRRIARTWIATDRVRVGGKPMRILTRPMKSGATIEICPPSAAVETTGSPGAHAAAHSQSQDLLTAQPHPALSVLYLDGYLLVINKPARLLTEHDRFGSPSVESLAPAILVAAGERGAHTRIWLVHRLDAGTSGVVVLARTPMAASTLSEAFRMGGIHKTYLALCQGAYVGEQRVDAPIARDIRTRHRVSSQGKSAQTQFSALATGVWASLVQAEPLTGRTHQIRVHLTHLGHPLLGDGLYGGPMYTSDREPVPIGRPMLHAARIVFTHPKTGARMEFSAPLPDDFARLAARLHLVLPSPLLGA